MKDIFRRRKYNLPLICYKILEKLPLICNILKICLTFFRKGPLSISPIYSPEL
jgi:hypothetical protein